MMQLFEDIPGTLVLLFCAILGWILSKWTIKYFKALVIARGRETAKLGESLDVSLDEDREPVALRISQLAEVKPFPKESKETECHRHAEARRRRRRRAKAAQVDTEQGAKDECNVAESLQGEEVGVVASTLPAASLKRFDDDNVFGKHGLAVKVKIFDAAEKAMDTPVQGNETHDVTTRAASMDGTTYDHEGDTATIEFHGTPLEQLVEKEVSDDVEFVQIASTNHAPFEDVEKHEASIPIGSSTHDDSNSGTFSDDDCSTKRTFTLDDVNLVASERVDTIQLPCMYAERAHLGFHIDGDGWMLSFEELQHAQLQNDVGPGGNLISPQSSLDESMQPWVEPTLVTSVHRERTFEIDGRVFAPFTDVQGRTLYTDGELAYAATSVLQDSAALASKSADSTLLQGAPKTCVPSDGGFDLPALEILARNSCKSSVGEAIETRFLLCTTSKKVSNVDSDSEGKEAWATCWDFVSGGAW